jgi:hypothetical protein
LAGALSEGDRAQRPVHAQNAVVDIALAAAGTSRGEGER